LGWNWWESMFKYLGE